MNANSIRSEIDADGNIELTHPVLGKIATLVRYSADHWGQCPPIVALKFDGPGWVVRPYRFPAYQRTSAFRSRHAAEAYAVALANEMLELDLKPKPGE